MRVRSFLAVCLLLGLESYAAASDALTVIGLIFSTLLTFGVVPVLYSLFFRVKFT